MSIKSLNKQEFLQKVADWDHPEPDGSINFKGRRRILVDFYATWCGPCQMLAPILEKAAEVVADSVDFYKVDIDANRETARAYRVRSVPTLILFHPDGTIERRIGLQSLADLANWLER